MIMANALAALFFFGCIMCLAIGALIPLIGTKLYRLRKSLIVFVEPNTRHVSLAYKNVTNGAIKTKERDYLLEGKAKHSGKNSAWLIDPVTGWNFVAPTREETFDKELKYAVLEPSNPQSYHRAIHRHRWTDVMRAGEDKDKWANIIPIVALIGLFALLAILGALVWIAGKLSDKPNPLGG